MKKARNLSLIYTLLTVLCWSTAATAIKITLFYLNPLVGVFYATLFSFLTLVVLATFQKKWIMVGELIRKNTGRYLLLGFLNPFFYYLVLFYAYDLSWAQEAMSLNYTWSIFLTIFSVLILHQKLKLTEIVAIFLSFIGVLILTSQGKLSISAITHPKGILLALGSALIWATYWILNMKWGKEALCSLLIQFGLGTVLLFIFCLLTGAFQLPILRKGLLGSMYVGLFEMSIPFYFWFLALKSAKKTVQPANLIFLSPLLSFILIALLLKEKILPSSVIGFVFILAGIILQSRSSVTKSNL
jgi:drug/metabolite transporter (DMT)-like permease